MFRDLYFEYPYHLYLFFFLFLFVPLLWYLNRFRQKNLQLYTDQSHAGELVLPRSSFLTILKQTLWLLTWIFASFAILGPKGNIRYAASLNPQSATGLPKMRPHEVIFLVDNSASMSVKDTSEGQTRLDEAKDLIEEIISQLQGQTISLYTFTSEAILVVPPTLDYLFTRLATKGLQIDESDKGGTDFAQVFKEIRGRVFNKPSSKLYTLILISDGGDNHLEQQTGETKQQGIKKILDEIPNPQKWNLKIFTIGVGAEKESQIPFVMFKGKPVYSRLEPEILKQLAAYGKGAYYDAEKLSDWDLIQNLSGKMFSSSPLAENQATSETVKSPSADEFIYDLYFQIPLGLAIVCFLLALTLPSVRRL